MKTYINVMEDLVEKQYDEIKDRFGCCDCEICRNDIVALALNQLPARYVATPQGSMISKADSIRYQAMTDITAALMRASMVVKDSPRH